MPLLLISRAFATIAPDRYHTTVDSSKHEGVIAWFEQHSNFRAPPSPSWADSAASLTTYLSRIKDLGQSIFIRNMFPWFVHTQLRDHAGQPTFRPGHDPRPPETSASTTAEIRRIRLRHNELLGVLYDKLVREHGKEAVGTEQPSGRGGFVDAVVRFPNRKTWIYELKVVRSAGSAVREAIGQLLEYAYQDGAWKPEKLFVVAEPELDADARKFIQTLRGRFKLPLEYLQVLAPRAASNGIEN